MVLTEHQLASAPIIQRLPIREDPSLNDAVPHELIGATVINMGIVDNEWGLVIDFLPVGQTKSKRIVLSFDETIMSVRFLDWAQGPCSSRG